MNKYQDAWNNVKGMTGWGVRCSQDEKDIEAIEELVNKEIPMKPIKTKWEYACGKCMNAIHVENEIHCEVYCDNCSQKIDWSEVHEENKI